MSYIKNYKDLIVWQKSMLLVELVYKITAELPAIERFNLSSQMIRSAVSIPSNIAEGQARSFTKEFIQFVSIAYGSSFELETQLLISKSQYKKINYVEAEKQLTEVQRMLISLIKALRK